MRTLFVAVLLAASTTLMAKTDAKTFVESIALRQTEQLVKPLDLSKKQTNKILAINQDYAYRNSLLFGQREVLKSLGYMTPTVQQNLMIALSNRFEARKLEIQAVLNDEQLVAYDIMLTDLKKDLNKSMRFMGERSRVRFDS